MFKCTSFVRVSDGYGMVFVVRPERVERSPLEVEGMDLGVTVEEIVELVRGGRRRYGRKTI